MACYIKFIPFAYRSNPGLNDFIGVCFFSHFFLKNKKKIPLPGYIRLKPIEKAEWKTRVMSNWNSVISTLLCCAGLMFDHQMWTDPVYYKSPCKVHVQPMFTLTIVIRCVGVLYAISLASGYFWADLCMISYFGIEPLTPIVVHHLLAGIVRTKRECLKKKKKKLTIPKGFFNWIRTNWKIFIFWSFFIVNRR